MKLTDTQLGLLSAAPQREDCGIELTANLTGGAAQKLVPHLDGLQRCERVQASNREQSRVSRMKM